MAERLNPGTGNRPNGGEVRNPAALLAHVLRREAANAARDDQTRQRRFERGFLSADVPNGDGEAHDHGDGGRAVGRIVGALDAPLLARARERRWQAALARLSDRPELRRTLVAIRRFREREKIISALRIKTGTYRERLSQLTKIFKP